MTHTAEAAATTATRRWAQLDEARQKHLRTLLVDALGLAAAGTAAAEAVPVLDGLGFVAPGAVRVPWTDVRLSAPQATTALSTLIHAWDFDDTHDEAVVHTASVVVPAVLAAAAVQPAAGEGVLDGLTTGVHVLSRLARLTGPRPGVIRTAGLGAVAAAASAATVWGLDDDAVDSAMALALTAALAPATRQAVVDSSVAKRTQPGLAAAVGMSAAALARSGVIGPAGWLGGSYGLVPGSGLSRNGLFGGEHEVDQVALKPYPACRYTHAAVAAAEVLHDAHPDPADLGRLVVHVPAGDAYRLVARPYEDRGAPIIDAQFSIPWQLAALWVTGGFDLTTLREQLGNAEIAAAAARIEVRQDLPENTMMSGARVDLELPDGTVRSAEAAMPGSGGRLDTALIDRKLRTCLEVAGAAAPDVTAAALWQLATELPALDAAATAAALDRHLAPLP